MLVNEFQHVIEGRRDKLGHNMTDWFKRLYDDSRTPMGFLGTPAMERVLEINEQFPAARARLFQRSDVGNAALPCERTFAASYASPFGRRSAPLDVTAPPQTGCF